MPQTSHPLLLTSRRHSPLKYDEPSGSFRILIVGNSGVGKSTIAEKLSRILNVPVIHLDAVYFKPQWRETPEDEFYGMVQSFMHENHSGWIIDGDYEPVADLVRAAATCILWLDPPFMLYFPRLIVRTFLQQIGVVPPCSPGCNDNLMDLIFWEGKSVVWWCWTHCTPLKEGYTRAMQQPGAQGAKWVRLSGWVGEVNAWLKEVEIFAKAR